MFEYGYYHVVVMNSHAGFFFLFFFFPPLPDQGIMIDGAWMVNDGK